jgi:hypothetical protein
MFPPVEQAMNKSRAMIILQGKLMVLLEEQRAAVNIPYPYRIIPIQRRIFHTQTGSYLYSGEFLIPIQR